MSGKREIYLDAACSLGTRGSSGRVVILTMRRDFEEVLFP